MFNKCQKHLDHVHESYFQHLCFATVFGARLILGGVGAILHGLFPAVFQTVGSRTVFALHDALKKRAQAQDGQDHA